MSYWVMISSLNGNCHLLFKFPFKDSDSLYYITLHCYIADPHKNVLNNSTKFQDFIIFLRNWILSVHNLILLNERNSTNNIELFNNNFAKYLLDRSYIYLPVISRTSQLQMNISECLVSSFLSFCKDLKFDLQIYHYDSHCRTSHLSGSTSQPKAPSLSRMGTWRPSASTASKVSRINSWRWVNIAMSPCTEQQLRWRSRGNLKCAKTSRKSVFTFQIKKIVLSLISSGLYFSGRKVWCTCYQTSV